MLDIRKRKVVSYYLISYFLAFIHRTITKDYFEWNNEHMCCSSKRSHSGGVKTKKQRERNSIDDEDDIFGLFKYVIFDG